MKLEESFEFYEKEERARLVAEERGSERRNQVQVLNLWKHVHECFRLEESCESFCCCRGNMLMNV